MNTEDEIPRLAKVYPGAMADCDAVTAEPASPLTVHSQLATACDHVQAYATKMIFQILELKQSNELLAKKVAELENPWIPVSEKPPEEGILVDIWHGGKRVADVKRVYRPDRHTPYGFIPGLDCFLDNDSSQYWGATHWMPLPQPPKGESQ